MTVTLIKATTKEEQRKLADDALKAKLYVCGWLMSEYLRDIRDLRKDDYEIAVLYEDGIAVGVAVDTWKRNLNVFVRKAKRRKGYGRLLVNAVKREGSYGICGTDGEGKIFTKNGVAFR